MPLTREDVPRLTEFFRQRSRDLHDPDSMAALSQVFVDGERDPVAKILNRNVLEEAFEESVRFRKGETRSSLSQMDPSIATHLGVDRRTGSAFIRTSREDLSRATGIAAERYISEKRAREAGTVESLLLGALGGAVEGSANMIDFFGVRDAVGGEDFAAFQRQFQTFVGTQAEEGRLSGQIGAGVGHLAPFVAVATSLGPGILLKGRAALGTLPSFTVAGALTSPEGERTRGAISGALGAVAMNVGGRFVGQPLAGRLTNLVASRLPKDFLLATNRTLGARAGRYLVSRAIPEISQMSAEFMGFGTLGALEQLYDTGSVDLRVLAGTNLGIIGLMRLFHLPQTRRVRGLATLERIRTGVDVLGRRGTAELETLGGIFREPRTFLTEPGGPDLTLSPAEFQVSRSLFEKGFQGRPEEVPISERQRAAMEGVGAQERPLGLPQGAFQMGPVVKPPAPRPNVPPIFRMARDLIEAQLQGYELEVARRLADEGILVTPEVAREIAQSPDKAVEILAKDHPHLLKDGQFDEAVLKAQALKEAGMVVDLNPIRQAGIVEASLKVPELSSLKEDIAMREASLLKTTRDQAEPAVRAIEDVEEGLRVGVGIREVYVKKALQLRELSKKDPNPVRSRNILEQSMEMLRKAETATPLREVHRRLAQDVRAKAEELPFDNPNREPMLRTAERLELRSAIDPLAEARISTQKTLENRMASAADTLQRTADALKVQGRQRADMERAKRLLDTIRRMEEDITGLRQEGTPEARRSAAARVGRQAQIRGQVREILRPEQESRHREKMVEDLEKRALDMRRMANSARAERKSLERAIREKEMSQGSVFLLKDQQNLLELLQGPPELELSYSTESTGPTAERILERISSIERKDPRERPEQKGQDEPPGPDATRRAPDETHEEKVLRDNTVDFDDALYEKVQGSLPRMKPEVRRKLRSWLDDVKTWLSNDRKGKPPKPPSALFHKRGLKQLNEVVRDLYARFTSDADHANDVAARIAGPRSRAATILRKGDKDAVLEVLRVLHETSTGLSPSVKLDLSRQRGSFDVGVLGGIYRLVTDPFRSGRLRLKEEVQTPIEAAVRRQDDIDMVAGQMNPPGTPGDNVLQSGHGDGGYVRNVGRWWDQLVGQVGVFRKILNVPWKESFIRAFTNARDELAVRLGIMDTWIVNHIEVPMNEYLKGVKPEARAALGERLFDMRHEGVDVSGLDASAQKILHNVHRFYRMYRDVVSFHGFNVRPEETYVTFIREGLGEIYRDATTNRRVKEVTSGFEKQRLREDPEGVLKDLVAVTKIYMISMERSIAWRPVSGFLEGMKKHYGVVNSREFPRKKGREPVPVAAAEWMDAQIRIMQGIAGNTSAALERFAQSIAKRFVGDRPGAGRELINGWVKLNYYGALGMNPASAIKNLTQNVFTISEIGLFNWVRGVREFWTSRSDGLSQSNRLLHEMGVFEGSFVRSTAKDIEGHLTSTLNPWRKVLDGEVLDQLFFLFKNAEILNRGVAGLGAYRAAERTYRKQLAAEGKTGDSLDKGVHDLAMAHAKDIIRRTQFDFSRAGGGQAFSGSAGRALGQFARFNINALDYLQLMFRRALNPRSAGGDKLPLLPGQSALAPLLRYISASFVLTMGPLNAMGISIDDVEGPGGVLPDPVKFGIGKVGELAADVSAIRPGATGASSLLFAPQDPGAQLRARQAVRDGLRAVGVEGRDRSPMDVILGSLGPVAGQAGSIADFVLSRDRESFEKLGREMALILPAGLQAVRILRAFKEEKEGFVRSRASNQRLFPEDRRMTAHERFLRVMGLESRTLDDEMDLLTDDRLDEEFVNEKTGAIRAEAIRRLVDGEDRSDVVGFVMAGFKELWEQTGQSVTLGDLKDEVKHILGEHRKKSGLTLRQRVEERAPLRRMPGFQEMSKGTVDLFSPEQVR